MRLDLPAPSLAQNRGVREVRGKVREVETGQGVRADDNEINELRGDRELRELRELVCKVPRVRARDLWVRRNVGQNSENNFLI